MSTWATPYQPAYPPCSNSAQPGTIALSMVVKGLAPETTNLGIYNCRSVGGTSTQSIHSDGRAWDCGIPMLPGGRPNLALGNPILALLAANAVELGVQCVIWDDRIYSARHPNGSPYGGVSPHYDHLHIEMKWYEAQNLSVAEIAAILAAEQPEPPAPPDGDEDDMGKPYIVPLGGAQWVVALDLSSRVGIRSGTDLAKLASTGQYITGFGLTASQMAAIPIAGAVAVTNLEELLPPPIDEEP